MVFLLRLEIFVREIKNTIDRKELQNSKDLHEAIVEQLIRKMPLCKVKQYIVSGVRQKEILKYFVDVTLIWIECPKKERKKRYQERARKGDTYSFKEAEQGDIDLGILDVKRYILSK